MRREAKYSILWLQVFANVQRLALLFLAATGCSPAGAQPHIAYEGQRVAPRVQVGPLPRLDALADRYEYLGTTTVSCQQSVPASRHFVVALASLDCTANRLARVVEEQAIGVGGTALLRFLCQRLGDTLECSADVVRKGGVPAGGLSAVRQRVMAMARIEFEMSAGAVLGEPWSFATERTYEPVSDRRLGRLSATVNEPGRLADAREALFDAAAALGGANVIVPTCADDPAKRTSRCTALISTPRLDPRREPRTR